MNKLIDRLNRSRSVFHAANEIITALADADYTRLSEGCEWKLEKGRGYFVTRNLSSVIAFRVPEGDFGGFMLTASHLDSPVFKIKENAEIEVKGKYIQLDTERYGGQILLSWLDRPLSFAGRVAVRTDKGVETRLIDEDKDSLVIPNVAIHMKRDLNDGVKYNPQTELVPLYSDYSGKASFKKRVAELAGCDEKDILGHDLYLYSRTPATVWGRDGEYFSAGRLDDLECAFTTLEGFLKCESPKAMPVLCEFDNEEVGSTTKQGADSTFLDDTLERIALALKIGREEMLRKISASFMLSCDNAHACHPNHPELSDSQNAVWMNEGIVIKESANQKYTSDAVSKAMLRFILDKAQVPCQFFANRSDMMGGGTLGNISSRHVSINTVDIGLAQLSMHSCYETAGTKDVEYMILGVKAFFESAVTVNADGDFTIA